GVLGVLLLLVNANNRLRSLITVGFKGQGEGELAYRLINAAVGWHMGSSHPWSGIGLGGVPLLYQKYRPIWAGRESEWAYQLHSTPVHLWAEMGGWGILPVLGAIILLLYRLWYWLRQGSKGVYKKDRILLWSLYGSLLAYGAISLTDYQLDNLCISGTLVMYLACLASIFRTKAEGRIQNSEFRIQSSEFKIDSPHTPHTPSPFIPVYAGLGILLAVIIWLIPIHRAWQLSSQGFMTLSLEYVEAFVECLSKAQRLAPWEPYYPYQVGWNLGNLALAARNPQQQQQEIQASMTGLQKAIAISPYQEFGYSNLAWLLLNPNPEAATQAFAKAIQLLPAKRGVMYGLGLSLLVQGKIDLAIEAISLEGLRDPLFITSPIWQQVGLKRLYPQVIERMLTRYTELLQKYSQPGTFNTNLHRSRGGLFWWQGDLTAARQDLAGYGTPLSQLMLELAAGQSPQTQLSQMSSSAVVLVMRAWLNSSQRSNLLQQAWILATGTIPPPGQVQAWVKSMEHSSSFDQWLKQNAPIWRYRRERSGFGVLSRHIDGSIPTDFFLVVENLPMNTWFAELLPSPFYEPELDLSLKPWREALVQAVSTFNLITPHPRQKGKLIM
ncbi:MAG: O-antigen ligase family protein, partial [Microcystaceae cyanobacterium]